MRLLNKVASITGMGISPLVASCHFDAQSGEEVLQDTDPRTDHTCLIPTDVTVPKNKSCEIV